MIFPNFKIKKKGGNHSTLPSSLKPLMNTPIGEKVQLN